MFVRSKRLHAAFAFVVVLACFVPVASSLAVERYMPGEFAAALAATDPFAITACDGYPGRYTIVVNSLADIGGSGDGLTTLREAIVEANGCGNVAIVFAPSLAGGSIQPLNALPALCAGCTLIDGDIDADGLPDIELDGSKAGLSYGLVLASANNEVHGLSVTRFGRVGIFVTGTAAQHNVVRGCYVGTAPPGNVALPNGEPGIVVACGASLNTVGPDNIVAYNAQSGILCINPATQRNTITRNRVTGNVGGGIIVTDGANGTIQAPYDISATETSVTGAADAPDGSIVEVFSDADGEADMFLGSALLVGGRFLLACSVGELEQVTATVTDPNGNTSALGKVCTFRDAVVTDFERYPVGASVVFQAPRQSNTASNLKTTPNSSAVTDEYAFSGTRSCKITWQFADANPTRWLRLTTSNTPILPNPAIAYGKALRIRLLLLQGSFYLCLGTRETGTHVCPGGDGAGYIADDRVTYPIEFVGATGRAGGDPIAPQGRLISARPGWQTVIFAVPSEPVLAFTGDGVLYSPSGQGTLEDLAFTINPADPNATGPFTVYIDDIEQIDPGEIYAADFDSDADVDLADFFRFRACFNGSNRPAAESGCEEADFDGDADVDVTDFSSPFVQCFNGPNRSPTCLAKPWLAARSHSGCLAMMGAADGATLYAGCSDDTVDATAAGGEIHIVHADASYNCCPDDIIVVLSTEPGIFRLRETGIVSRPCRCNCCYEIRSTIGNVPPGTNLIEYCWYDYETHTEQCRTLSVFVP